MYPRTVRRNVRAGHLDYRTDNLLSTAAYMNLKLRKYDVCNVYLYPELDKEIYIDSDDQKGNVLLLKNALYGLKQSGALWKKLVTKVLLNNGFKRKAK